MNKKVIALAVAGALASPLAATAQTANVIMYGSFRAAYESLDVDGLGRRNSIDSWSSRWGIRGIESIGGGLNGIFQLELGVGLDNPGAAYIDTATTGTVAVRGQPLAIREAWVGLNGGFGTFKMGAGLTSYDDVFGMDHLLLANGLENMNVLSGGVNPVISGGNNFNAYGALAATGGTGQTCNDSTAFDSRYGNAVRYDSPNFSGLTFSTTFAFLGENTNGFKCKGWDSNIIYRNGPIQLGLAYSRHIDFRLYDGDAWRVHGDYNFGPVKLLGAYEQILLDGNNGTTGSSKTSYWSVGLTAPIGPGVLTAQYGSRDNGANTTATQVVEVENGGGQQYSMSYKYGFSKRTYAYGWIAMLAADDAARTLTTAAPLGGEAKSFGFGLQHNF